MVERAIQKTVSVKISCRLSSSADYGLVMAASVITTLPLLIFFFFAQKKFVEGITMTGMKG